MAEILQFHTDGKVSWDKSGKKAEKAKGAATDKGDKAISGDYLEALSEVTGVASQIAQKYGFTVKDVLTDALVVYIERTIITRCGK